MIELGTVLAAVSAGAFLIALPGASRVERRIVLLRRAAQGPRTSPPPRIRGRRVALALTCAVATLFTPVPFVAPAVGYLAWVMPSLVADRRARRARVDAEAALLLFVERVEAVVAAGRPLESAVVRVAEWPTASRLLDRVLGNAVAAYTLGAPLYRALEAGAAGADLASLGDLARDLDRARDLGRGSLSVVRDARDVLRAAERARRLEAAGRIETRLMLILVLCYLPALMIAVVVPLFLVLLAGLAP